MSRYVTVLAPLRCVNCGHEGDFLSFFCRNFGKLNCLEYSIGDVVKWEKFDSVEQGGRPPEGAATVDGWTECPSCNAELASRVAIVSDTITNVEITSLFRSEA